MNEQKKDDIMQKLDKFLSLKKRHSQAQQEADQAEGAEREVMKQIKDEFSCNTLNDAKRTLKQKRKQEADSKEKFDTAFEKFEEDWPDD